MEEWTGADSAEKIKLIKSNENLQKFGATIFQPYLFQILHLYFEIIKKFQEF